MSCIASDRQTVASSTTTFVAGVQGFAVNVDLQPVFNHYKCIKVSVLISQKMKLTVHRLSQIQQRKQDVLI